MSSNFGPKPLLLIISAPSGGGKTTLCQQLLASRADMVRAITCTTRGPRPGEHHGADYYFLTPAAFEQHRNAEDFLESATVFGNSYGTLKAEVLDRLGRGNDVLLAVDVQGAAAIRRRAQDEPELKDALVTIFLTPASVSVLEMRLRNRGTDAPSVIERRLAVARDEVAQWRSFDYLIVSSSIADDLRHAMAIIDAEKMRVARAQPPPL